MHPPASSLVILSARISRLLPTLLAAIALAAPFVSRVEGAPKNWCVLVEDESATSAETADQDGEPEGEDEIAPKIPTKRPPFAEEVGPPAGSQESITPLPGLPLDTSFDNVSWIPQGPGLTKNGDLNIAPLHPTSGCVTAVVPHPTDQNTIYIGTANGGVWKTTNALSPNVRWKPLTDDQLSLSIGGLAMDRSDATGNTLVAGFGRRSSFGFAGGAHKGLLRTTDGGATWERIAEAGLAGRSIYQITVNGNVWLVVVPSTDNGTLLPGLYRTVNGSGFSNISGQVGSGLPAGAVTHLAAHPSNFSIQYLHVAGTGVYRTNDSGATWTNVSTGMAAANVGQLALTVAFDGTVFAAELAGTSRVYRSTNSGANWTQMDSVQANTGATFNGFVADPANSNLVYLSGLFTRTPFPFSGRVVRGNASLAAGSQWTSIASTQPQGTGTAPHTDSRSMAFTAGNRLIEGDDGGICELNIANVGSEGTGTGGGGTWRSLNGDLRVTEMHDMAYDRLSRIVIGGAQDAGFQEQSAPGLPVAGTAGWMCTRTGDGADAGVDLLASPGQSLRYGGTQFFDFFREVYDANNNRISVVFPPATLVGMGTAIVRGAPPPNGSGNMPFTTPIAVNAVAGGRLVLSGNANFYESLDQGNTVAQIAAVGANLAAKIANGGKFGGVAAPGILFFGQGSNVRFRTAASGAVTGVVAFPGGNVQGIVFDPENWKNAFVIGTTSVYSANDIATNGAAGFTLLTGNLTGVGTFNTIEYLTLPSGNAIMVGTDLGAFIMRLSAPGVWKTLGDNFPHALVYDSHFDPVGQVLVASTLGRGAWLYDFKPTKTTGQYGETFQAYVDGTASLPSAGELFSTHLGTATKISDTNLRELRLTADGTGGTRSAFRLPDLNPGRAVPAFSAKWNATLIGDFGNLADGFSLNFGPLGGVTGAAFTNGTYANEDGFNAGVTVSVRTFSGNAPGYYVRVNGAVVTSGYVFKASSDWGNFNSTRHFFEVDWRMDTGLTLRVDGVAIFTNLATPGFLPAVGDRFVFGARTGASDEEVSLDNIAIFTGGMLVPIQATAPYHFSSDFPSANQTADKAFDGNVNTKWLTLDYTGFIGASFALAKTVRLYTLTSAEDVPGRDLAAWDFQTGNDGVLWTQHGAQGAQFFQNRGEQRAFVVASPTQAGKFRILISENHEAPEIQLSEFQPWEFVPVNPFFTVTTNNQSGAGSLRQAISDAASFGGQSLIMFAPGLAGQTITLTSGPIVVSNPEGVIIDGFGLVGGLTISGNNASRVFNVDTGALCSLKNLTLTGGSATGAFPPNTFGGAILNSGNLILEKCTLTGNSAMERGGALYSSTSSDFFTTSSTLIYCTISGNTAAIGGGIHNNNGQTTLTHCTVSGNTAPAGSGGGVASFGDNLTRTTVRDSIIGGNTNGDVDFVLSAANNSFTSNGYNVIGSGNALADFNGPGDLVNTAPLLAPLDNYGGLTKTMALVLGSPARDASFGSTTFADQRGFPIVGPADIGAYEAGTLTNYNAYIWELLPASATIAQHLMSSDYDGDGMTNGNEYIALTNPGDPASVFRMTNIVRSGSNVDLTFTTVVGRNYTVEFSTDLVSYTPVVATFVGTGSPVTATIGPVTGFNRFFVRARTGP